MKGREGGFLRECEAGEESRTLILGHFQKQELTILFDLLLASSKTSV